MGDFRNVQAIQRGEKEIEDLVSPKRGKGGGKKGKGKGRRSRYNVVQAPQRRARPTHFVAIRLFSRMNPICKNSSQDIELSKT